MPAIFDSHAHYDDPAFDADRDTLLARLFGADQACPWRGIVNAGSSVASSRKSLRLAERFPGLFAAVGVHPEEAAAMTDADLAEIRTMAVHPKAVAVGGRSASIIIMKTPVPGMSSSAGSAASSNWRGSCPLPVILHDREAHGDMLDTLTAFFPAGPGKMDRAGGAPLFFRSVEMADEMVRRGFFIGLGGAVTFKNARRAVEVAASIPLDALLLETDAPYMAPVPYRGKRCDSGMIAATAARIAEIRGDVGRDPPRPDARKRLPPVRDLRGVNTGRCRSSALFRAGQAVYCSRYQSSTRGRAVSGCIPCGIPAARRPSPHSPASAAHPPVGGLDFRQGRYSRNTRRFFQRAPASKISRPVPMFTTWPRTPRLHTPSGRPGWCPRRTQNPVSVPRPPPG